MRSLLIETTFTCHLLFARKIDASTYKFFKVIFFFTIYFVSSKKDKGEVEVTHVVFEEPIYTVQDQVFYPPADSTYDIAPVTSSHPQSSSLGTYGDMSMYGLDDSGMSTYDALLGPPVPPPTSGLGQTYSTLSDLEDFSDD